MTPRTVPHGAYTLTDERAALDLDLAHRALSQDSYWAAGRRRDVHDAAFAASRVAAALDADGATVAFARAVTDGATFAWLCDVWVEPGHRGQRLGRGVVGFLVDAPDLVGVRRWLLATRDAHGMYASFGFEPLQDPARLMERRGPTI